VPPPPCRSVLGYTLNQVSEHPTPAELEAFLAGGLERDRLREVSRHLLKGCPDCRAVLAPLYASMEALPVDEPGAPAEVDYGQVLDSARCKARAHERYSRREDARARKIAALLEKGGGVKALADDADVPLRGLGIFKALIQRSHAVRHEKPREMVHLARCAVEVTRTLDPRHFPPAVLADLSAWAWAELANALRVANDLEEAEEAFGTAFNLFLEGTEDLYLKARLYDLHASFLGTKRQFALAFAALDIVYSAYLELGERNLAGKALLKKALYTTYSGQPEQGMRLNEEALGLIEEGSDPELEFSAVHNQLLYLVECGRFAEAKRLLFERRRELQKLSGRTYALRLRWIQARISAGVAEWESAAQALIEVRDGFEEEGMGFAAALASLELAAVWMRQGHDFMAEELALETVEVFVTLRIRREAFGALMILKDAIEKRKATVSLLEDVVQHLRRGDMDPEARFVPRGR